MFNNTYQHGLLSVFYSCGANPLMLWDIEVHNGHIKRITDKEVNSVVLELISTNVATTYISCPKGNQSLGIKLPFLVMIVKNMRRYFSFEITILDDKNMRRRFRISNFQSTTKIKPFCTTMPLALSHGWNQIQFNLADFTSRAYASNFLETVRLQIHANVRVRRIYFCDKLYSEDELPQDYKLYLPLEKKARKVYVAKSRSKEDKAAKSKREGTPEIQEDMQEVKDEEAAEAVESAVGSGTEVSQVNELEAPPEAVSSKTGSTGGVPATESTEAVPSKTASIEVIVPSKTASEVQVPSKTASPEKAASAELAPAEDAPPSKKASAEAPPLADVDEVVVKEEPNEPETNPEGAGAAAPDTEPPAAVEE